MTAPGDSGGGMFIDVDGIDYLAGVTSFGLAFDGDLDADYGDMGGYIRTSHFVDWIESVTGIFAGQAAIDLLGDFNFDGISDSADYTIWRDSYGQSVTPGNGADANGNGLIDGDDFLGWQSGVGSGNTDGNLATATSVPEPNAMCVVVLVSIVFPIVPRQSRCLT